jgi:hypothetical protein
MIFFLRKSGTEMAKQRKSDKMKRNSKGKKAIMTIIVFD